MAKFQQYSNKRSSSDQNGTTPANYYSNSNRGAVASFASTTPVGTDDGNSQQHHYMKDMLSDQFPSLTRSIAKGLAQQPPKQK
jgi:hypothetical protein